MRTSLRPIAVHVEEPKPRRFVWVLSERTGDRWAGIEKSVAPVDSYQRAMADGLLALQALVDDLNLGPRKAGRAGRASRPAETETLEEPATPAASTTKRYFGFGPAR